MRKLPAIRYLQLLITTVIVPSMLFMAPPAIAEHDALQPTGQWTAHSDGQAVTPPMGWSSWNAFKFDIDEAKIVGAAEAMVSTGLAAKGYQYVNIDDAWWLKRRVADGRMQIRTDLFPSARIGGKKGSSFKPITNRIHAMGLKAGIYSDIGKNSCGQAYNIGAPTQPKGSVAEREVGLYGHVDQDIDLYFNEWGFDFIKVDACGIHAYGADTARVRDGHFAALVPLIDKASINRTDVAQVKSLYRQVAQSLKTQVKDGDYVFSMCLWGAADVRSWGKDVGNMSRTSDDIAATWTSMLANYDTVVGRSLYARPHSWNDPDILHIGKGDFDERHLTEARSHFTLWAMVNAPLLIGIDLKNTPQSIIDIFGNEAVIELNQDAAGNQAVLAYDSDDVQILVKTLQKQDGKAVAIFNRGISPAKVTLTAEHLKFASDGDIVLTDLWSGKNLSAFKNETTIVIEPRQTIVFSASGKRQLANGLYLSEMPGRMNVAKDGVTAPQADPIVHRMISQWTGTRPNADLPNYTGWGGAQPDRTPYGEALQISGETFFSGIGILSNSRIEVRTDRAFSQFSASVGIDDTTLDPQRTVVFLVYGDGRLLAQSLPKKFADQAELLSADITGVNVVELVARDDLTGRKLPNAVTWGAARVTR
jgi:alpha-galactosidase